MLVIKELTTYLDQLLHPQLFNDYCPNGLQVEGRAEIKKLVSAVTANQALFAAAQDFGADAILVHHGLFWRGDDPCVTGIKRNRLTTLLQNNINLIAYHLPLDAHSEFGNNIQLASVLKLIPEAEISVNDNPNLVRIGRLHNKMNAQQFAKQIEQALHRKPLHISGRVENIETIAWCTGAAQDFITLAIDHGVDAYLTGEVSERTVHIAREAGIHFFAAGHHATERYGVYALGEHLAREFQLKHLFIDIDNPV